MATRHRSTRWAKTLFCTGLSINGQLDLSNNALQSGSNLIATIRTYVHSGYNAGLWNGVGIISSAADAHHGLGLGDAADGVVAGLPTNSIAVRWTRYGDLNLDGTVNFSDVLTLIQNYGQTLRNWDQGDVNYDTSVNFSDVLVLIQNYGGAASILQPLSTSLSGALAASTMPIKRRTRYSSH